MIVSKKIAILIAIAAAGSANAIEIVKPLSDFGYYKSIDLVGVNPEATVKIPVSPREKLDYIDVVLNVAKSSALLPERSSLVIKLNGNVLKQIEYKKEMSEFGVKLRIPRSELKVGFNELKVSAMQHYTYQCEDPASPELWTTINTDKSYISASFSDYVKNGNPSLSQLNTAFDQKMWSPQKVKLLTGSNYISANAATAISTIAQGLHLRKNNQPVLLEAVNSDEYFKTGINESELAGISLDKVDSDFVIIGKKSDIARYIPNEIYTGIVGPYLGINKLLGGKYFYLVVSGETDEDVAMAAKALANPEYVLPDSNAVVIKELPALKSKILEAGKPMRFSDVGFKTQTLQGFRPQPTSLKFYAPDSHIKSKDQYSELNLHIAYSGGIREDSTLVFKINGKFAASVPLSNVNGEEVTNLKVKISNESIQEGANLLEIQPIFMVKKENCGLMRDDHLNISIFEDSTINLGKSKKTNNIASIGRFGRTLGFNGSDAITGVVSDFNKDSINNIINMSRLVSSVYSEVIPVVWSKEYPSKSSFFYVGESGSIPKEYYDLIKNGGSAGSQMQASQHIVGDAKITMLIGQDKDSVDKNLKLLAKSNSFGQLDGSVVSLDYANKSINTVKKEDSVKTKENYFDLLNIEVDSKYYIIGGLVAAFLFATSVRRLSRRQSNERK